MERSSEYKYQKDDIINNKIILKQIRMQNGDSKLCKGYFVKCINDEYEWEVTEYNLVKRGCPVCSNKIILKGINDIYTTHPHLVKYFKHINDTYKYSHSCLAKVEMICPDCGFEKIRKIDGIARDGFICPKCGDGSSIPEKIMFSLLEQLKIDFKWEKTFDWSKPKRYDFYIPSLNCIIETHGSQHYEENKVRRGATLKDIQENDSLKEQLALYNGIKYYIVIDCRKSQIEFIKENILHSKLTELFNLSNIDWNECFEYAHSSRIKEACNLWNSGIENTTQISKIMNMSSNTICEYLKIGKELNWCNYSVDKYRYKKVLFLEENIIFENVSLLSAYLSDKLSICFQPCSIRLVCQGKQKSYNGLHFIYI